MVNIVTYVSIALVASAFISPTDAITKAQLDDLLRRYMIKWFEFQSILPTAANAPLRAAKWQELETIKAEFGDLDYYLGQSKVAEFGQYEITRIFQRTLNNGTPLLEQGIVPDLFLLLNPNLPNPLNHATVGAYALVQARQIFGGSFVETRYSCAYTAFTGANITAQGEVTRNEANRYVFFVMAIAQTE